MSREHALVINELVVRRGRFSIGPVDLNVQAGDCLALVGPNGCGKTTMLWALAGRLPYSGRIEVAGRDLSQGRVEALSQIGFAVPIELLPDMLTPRQCFEIAAEAKGLNEVEPTIAQLAERLDLVQLDKPVSRLSLGMRQKTGILIGLSGAPSVVLFDEVFNGLDIRSRRALREELQHRQERGAAILLATHDLDNLRQAASRALFLEQGKIQFQWTSDDLNDAIDTGLEDAILSFQQR